ncbi:SIR2 family protein [Hymenobacter mucosus]|uniref:SIR2-like domain-containing protein n=1 Tax=Hymenobacter mucosus TaxID=1411120 RepID=A0A239AUK3_9BACT|nr:SIR2 family protein [Hymenobacter mucosus]SNR99386.1 SIR2-like domain-containing protein [Hymenobacter mucosus]
MHLNVNNAGIVATLLKNTPKPIFLLGAGASVTSGIPLAGDIVSKASKWAYARQNGKDPDDPRITRSDWLPWLRDTQAWFKEDVSMGELFPYAVESLLQPQTARKQFWVKILNPDMRVSIGYLRLAELMHLSRISTVLTTNFDECIGKARNEINQPAMIDYVRTAPEYVKISATPPFPVSVFLHGDVNNYSDRNVIEEIERMDEELVQTLVPLLKDHPLVVVGYRGGEASIMEHLLISNAQRANNYKNGIYWCLRKGEKPEDATDYVKTLSSIIGTNFQFIEIESFDHLLDKVIWPHLGEKKIKVNFDRSLPVVNRREPTVTSFDLKSAIAYQAEDFDAALLRLRIVKYCEKLKISIPDTIDSDWLTNQMVHLNLVRVDHEGNLLATYAGLLLFAKKPQEVVSKAQVVIKFAGPTRWLRKLLKDDSIEEEFVERTISGNLWIQLKEIDEALALVNKPFRLKNEESTDVTPYDPIALKEVVVNSLVHRDYEVQETNVIEINPGVIRIFNPGGLMDEVRPFFEDEVMIDEIRRGRRGIKGYRNPVLADLFYGAGAMDKRGSGLYDVVQRVQQNAGHVDFEANLANTEFTVLLQCRPEAVDEITQTAVPLRVITTKYTSNILEIQHLPEYISYAESLHSSRKEMFETYPTLYFPPFELFEKQVFTLTDLRIRYNTLRNLVKIPTIATLALDEYLAGNEGEKRFVRLLNDSLKSHFFRCGLVVDVVKKRAYFPKSDDGARVIAYKARFKKTKRTVARPRYAVNKETIRYWEHKAFYYSVRRIGEQWCLFIEPTYVFTLNGQKDLLESAKVGRLATKKMSHDYNQSVLNDLVFWLRTLSGEPHQSFVLHSSTTDGLGDNILIGADYVGASQNDVTLIEGEFDELDDEEDESDVDPEIGRLADQQREELGADEKEWDDTEE